MALVALWFTINVPLTLLGSYIGNKHGAWRHPVRINSIPRQIPRIQWYLKTWPATFIGGLLPFATGFLELFFMLNSLFGTKVYYAFGFLTLTFLVTALVSWSSLNLAYRLF
jgi:transmembrane 9 superfamily member 2/4